MADLRDALRRAAPVGAPLDVGAVRRRVGRRRRRRRVLARGAPALVVAAAVVAAVGLHGTDPEPQAVRVGSGPGRSGAPTIRLPDGQKQQLLAASATTLYVASSDNGLPPYELTAYDTTTGRLVRRITVPSEPAALRVGPVGHVWLTFYADQAGGPSGTWLLSADLDRRSLAPDTSPTALLPTGPTTALAADQHGIEILRLPPPGHPGRSSEHRLAGTSIGPPLDTAPAFFAGFLDKQIAVQVTDGNGNHSHVVIAGAPGLTYGGRPSDEVEGVVDLGDHNLWVVTTSHDPVDRSHLVELDGRLGDVTPPAILHDPLFRTAEGVWAYGDTVWVALASRPHLACFTAGDGRRPVVAVPLAEAPVGLAVAGDTVFLTGAGATSVVGHPVPAACR